MGTVKRLGILVLAVMLAGLPLLSARAEDFGGTQVVSCPWQGFRTRCEAGTTWRWDDEYGLTLHIGGEGGLPCLMILASDVGSVDFERYFAETLTPWMERCLGKDLLSASDYAVYTLGEGIELPGVMYTFLDIEGRRQVLFRLFDARWDGCACYTLRYYDGEADDALRALGIAVRGFERIGAAPAPAMDTNGATLRESGEIACPPQGWTSRCEAARAVRWRAGEGLYVYLGEEGRLPYVLVNVAEGEQDPEAFFEGTATPWMRWRYGDDLAEVIDCGNLTVGGRVMRGVGYRYRRDGEAIYALRVLENLKGRSASYIAKFSEDGPGEREAAMAALEAIAGVLRLE